MPVRGQVAALAGVDATREIELAVDPHRAHPGDVRSAIGAHRYQVGPDVHEAVSRSFGPAAPAFLRPDPSAPGRWLLDLPSANRHALRAAGVNGITEIGVGSTPSSRNKGALGRPIDAAVAISTTNEPLETPAIPLLVSISVSMIINCWPGER